MNESFLYSAFIVYCYTHKVLFSHEGDHHQQGCNGMNIYSVIIIITIIVTKTITVISIITVLLKCAEDVQKVPTCKSLQVLHEKITKQQMKLECTFPEENVKWCLQWQKTPPGC